MADFVAVLKKTLDGMGETTPESRRRVYEKARQTVAAKLAAINPPPPPSVADRQRRALEDAISAVERQYSAGSDPLSELEDVFASLKNPQPKPLDRPVVKTGARPTGSQAPAAALPTRPVAQPPRQAAPVPPPAPPRQPPAPPVGQMDAFGPEVDDEPDDYVRARPEPVRRRSYGPLIVAALLLAVVAGGGYGIWLNRDTFGALIGLGGTPATQTAQTDPADAVPAENAEADAAPETQSDDPAKFTQRLTPEGSEVDPGPANGGSTVAEGTSVSALTQPPGVNPPMAAPPADDQEAIPGATAAAPDATGSDAALAVAQKAIFYEERTSGSEGSAEPGTTVWSLVEESPGANLPPEPAIRAETSIPGKDIRLRLTIKRNADESLPASHIIEMIFLTPDNFPGGGVDNILRIAMKGSEQEAGNPLIGIPAKIADGFFLVALNDSQAETEANLTLLRRQSWIDIPVVYKSGRRALFTMEKGVPGDQVFDEALKAWSAATAAANTTPG